LPNRASPPGGAAYITVVPRGAREK
jgi:hypothetical protein